MIEYRIAKIIEQLEQLDTEKVTIIVVNEDTRIIDMKELTNVLEKSEIGRFIVVHDILKSMKQFEGKKKEIIENVVDFLEQYIGDDEV